MEEQIRLQEWIKENDFTLSDFGKEVGFHRSTISLVVNGKRPITNNFRWKFREAFGEDVANNIFHSPGATHA